MEPEIQATIKFKVKADHDLTEKAYEVRCTPPDGLPRLNFEQQWVENIPVYNMRPLLAELSLDTQGFVAVELPTKMAYEDFFHEEKLRTVYAEEIREYLKNYLGASCIFFHECVVRNNFQCSADMYPGSIRDAHG
ncbi:hypothetical protein V500_01933 [Pseudogymnoascus sp. VKM F-4518 (FW-2643)]|nr:hypothetical protein V500_01933 [Pseudogymnoascus sp. VKM F-4518 (FW-2643)]